jgi:starch synthase
VLRILFVASEVHPLIKTGGLADVAGSLPHALAEQGHEVRILMPAYADALERTASVHTETAYRPPAGAEGTSLVRTQLPDSGVPVWLLDGPGFSDRPGNPYLDPDGHAYPDNHWRFNRLARAATAIAGGMLDWHPDVVHCNDWQTGLTPVWLMMHRIPAATVFTVHNLAYQGLFPAAAAGDLGLPAWLYNPAGLEFYDQLSFMKGGLVLSDQITTVSPTYAREIQTPAYGWGLDGLLRGRAAALHGILNGIDYTAWDPQGDPHLSAPFSAAEPAGKADNKTAVQRELSLDETGEGTVLLGLISRLADQKGVDLLLDVLDSLMHRPVQLAVLGSGEPHYELGLRRAAERHPGRIGVHIGFNEGLAHRIEAGSDLFLMPSRFEPCGLNQMYSLRYGTLPVVHRVGGLADSVVDATEPALEAGHATGFAFDEATGNALLQAIDRALHLHSEQPGRWRAMRQRGMQQDFSWERSAREYDAVYRAALDRQQIA